MDYCSEGYVFKADIFPFRKAALPRGYLGKPAFGNGLPVSAGQFSDNFVLGDKGQGKGTKFVGNAVKLQHIAVVHRVRFSAVAYAVYAAYAAYAACAFYPAVNKGVVFKVTAAASRYRAYALVSAFDNCKAAAVHDIVSLSRNASYIRCSVNAAFCAASEYRGFGLSRNAARKASVAGAYVPESCAAYQAACFHIACDASRAVFLRDYFAVINAAAHYCLGLVHKIKGALAHGLNIALGVEAVLYRHGASYTACVHISVYLSVINAVGDLSVGTSDGIF